MNSESNITAHLPPHLLRWLDAYQREHQFPSLEVAIVDIVCKFYAQTERLPERVAELEQQVNALSREVIHLRQQLPETYDRLREQLAAVRLSHSGILHNLRDRLEALEAEVFANPPSAADAEADS
ncbi:hypothetical protein [uncultured Thermosynechococcus sp.]|uniref:hypothetical protein n=1 Tax=uncultured Thermosynechococcus sp. TaxID=436945 RepID=UPI002603B8C8|nr:hypothetical protein [uncultured Thermosynechococcus sp.]